MRSALYRGHIGHERLLPRRHAFSYGLHLFYLDLEELPSLCRDRRFWSLERWNLLSFRRADYLGDPAQPLREAVLDRVEEQLGRRPTGRVGLVGQVRTLGYVFNPVCFYFCHDEHGVLDAIVAEITNTPWRERHAYVLDATGHEGDVLVFRFQKDFHVSPFFDLDQEYEWRFTPVGERLEVSMTNREHDRTVFRAGLACERVPLTGRNLAAALLRSPLQPLRLHAAIYWQAARLWLKRIPFFVHPDKRVPTQDTPPV